MFPVCMQAYAKLRTDTPELLDLVAQFGGQDLTDDPMAVDGQSSAPVANSGELNNNSNNNNSSSNNNKQTKKEKKKKKTSLSSS